MSVSRPQSTGGRGATEHRRSGGDYTPTLFFLSPICEELLMLPRKKRCVHRYKKGRKVHG